MLDTAIANVPHSFRQFWTSQDRPLQSTRAPSAHLIRSRRWHTPDAAPPWANGGWWQRSCGVGCRHRCRHARRGRLSSSCWTVTDQRRGAQVRSARPRVRRDGVTDGFARVSAPARGGLGARDPRFRFAQPTRLATWWAPVGTCLGVRTREAACGGAAALFYWTAGSGVMPHGDRFIGPVVLPESALPPRGIH
jgi:hypothetical protein